jgi:hypothetical protein
MLIIGPVFILTVEIMRSVYIGNLNLGKLSSVVPLTLLDYGALHMRFV